MYTGSWLIQNGLTVAVMLPVVWLLCRVFRWRPACQYWLWSLLLVKLLLPPLVIWPCSSIDLRQLMTVHTPREASPDATGSVSVDDTALDDTAIWLESPAEVARPPATLTWHSFWQSAQQPIVLTWLLGSIVALLLAWGRILSTHRLLRTSQPPTAALQATVDKLRERFRRRCVRLRISQRVASPSVVAWGRAILLWPRHLADGEIEKGYEAVVAHEMAHLQRGDHWFTWLELGAGIIWWWNPVYWLICRKLHETRELACDAIAMGITGGAPREYALQLLEMTTGQSCSVRPVPMCGVGVVSQGSLHRRLKMLFEERLSGRTSMFGFMVAALLTLPLLPTWSWGDNGAEPAEKLDVPPASSSAEPPSAKTPANSDLHDLLKGIANPPAADPVEKSVKVGPVRYYPLVGLAQLEEVAEKDETGTLQKFNRLVRVTESQEVAQEEGTKSSEALSKWISQSGAAVNGIAGKRSLKEEWAKRPAASLLVEGRVTAVEDDLIEISIGLRDGLVPKQSLCIWRGNPERFVGLARVINRKEDKALARIEKTGSEPVQVLVQDHVGTGHPIAATGSVDEGGSGTVAISNCVTCHAQNAPRKAIDVKPSGSVMERAMRALSRSSQSAPAQETAPAAEQPAFNDFQSSDLLPRLPRTKPAAEQPAFDAVLEDLNYAVELAQLNLEQRQLEAELARKRHAGGQQPDASELKLAELSVRKAELELKRATTKLKAATLPARARAK